MLWIIAILYLVLMGFAGRAHGKGGWPKWCKIAAKAVLGLSFAVTNYALFEIWWLAILAGILSAVGLSLGHGRFYNMQGANLDDPNPEKIERFVAIFYKGDITKPAYSWVCMGMKGLLIGLAAAPFGLVLAIAWPLCYWLSFKYTEDSPVAEVLSCLFAGIVVLACVA